MYNREFTPERITQLKADEIFVFGSNLAGAHGGGAARLAYERFGAIWGQGVGMQGQSYAIPTMQGGADTVRPYVDQFIDFADSHRQYTFFVTRIGCGIAGFTPSDIAPLFVRAVDLPNVLLPQDFVEEIDRLCTKRPSKPVATKNSWKNLPMPAQSVVIPMSMKIPSEAMRLVKRGHIPEAMEDHWFMYCDDITIRYYRSWSGFCIYIAKYVEDADYCTITELEVNRDPEQYSATDNDEDVARFTKLLRHQYVRYE